jgi:hypothetical protein
VKHLQAYDLFLKKLGQNGAKESGLASVGLGPILIVTLPFFLAILIVSAIFETFVEKGPIGNTVYLVIGLVLLFALFYSGFRVVHYRAQWLREK